jgi:hypothetical protein
MHKHPTSDFRLLFAPPQLLMLAVPAALLLQAHITQVHLLLAAGQSPLVLHGQHVRMGQPTSQPERAE